jgi:hypothetical protein
MRETGAEAHNTRAHAVLTLAPRADLNPFLALLCALTVRLLSLLVVLHSTFATRHLQRRGTETFLPASEVRLMRPRASGIVYRPPRMVLCMLPLLSFVRRISACPALPSSSQ